jgi:tRNA threonylcarbamoyladenosine biosynthesis protein TsaE
LESIDLNHSSRHPLIVETATGARLRLVWTDEAATQAFAETLARQPDIANAFISLQGDLGAGKTTLVRHLLRALGVSGRIKSPTYAVVEPYQVDTRQPPLDAWHFDFYRFSDPREWEDAGFRDIFASPGLKLAEWPDKAHALLPIPDLHLVIDTLADATRAVTLTAGTAAGVRLLNSLTPPEIGA